MRVDQYVVCILKSVQQTCASNGNGNGNGNGFSLPCSRNFLAIIKAYNTTKRATEATRRLEAGWYANIFSTFASTH